MGKGGQGGVDLAEKVLKVIEKGDNKYAPLYDLELPLEEKIRTIAQKVYGAKDIEFAPKARKQLAQFTGKVGVTYQYVWRKHNTLFLTMQQN